MRQSSPLAAISLVIALTACDQAPPPPDEPATPTQTLAASASDKTGFLGPVTFHYDPDLLGTATVQLAIPPEGTEKVYGTKLLPLRGVSGETGLCPDEDESCPLDDQPGLTLALLERPFETYERALRESTLEGQIRPLTLAGAQGIVVEVGRRKGLDVAYQVAPVKGRALILQVQRDGETPAEDQAISHVIDSIAVGD